MNRPPLPSEVLHLHDFYGNYRLLDYLLPQKRFAEAVLEIGVDRRAAWMDYFVRAALFSVADSDAVDSVDCDRFDVILCRCPVVMEKLLKKVKVGGLVVLECSPAYAFTREN